MLVYEADVTLEIFNKYSNLPSFVTPVTRVTPHLEGYIPRHPGSINPTSVRQVHFPQCAGAPEVFLETRGRKPAEPC